MEQFDYVIVGGGSAGSVLACRLSEHPGTRICVVEAGPPDTNRYIRIPSGTVKTLFDERLAYQIDCEPSWGTDGRSIRLATGRTLGGSSAINGMIYYRGQRRDYDGWAAMGAAGWGFEDVLPYFRRSERRIGESNSRYRGDKGPMPISDAHWPAPICEAFAQAALDAGFSWNLDYNASEQEGLFAYQAFIWNGRRVSAADAFLHPAAKRKNVDIRTDAQVTRILFEGRRAIGIAYRGPGGEERRLRAGRGVIVSAGAIHTPKLLQLSGLGPPPLLQGLGIPVVHSLPGVGENLKDHYAARIVARAPSGIDTINRRVRQPRLAWEVAKWMIGRPNVIGNPPILLGVAGRSDPALDGPDYCITFLPASFRKGLVAMLDDFPGLTCGGYPLKPASRGYVRAASRDDRQLPAVQPHYLAEPADRRVMVAALKVAHALVAGPAMSCFVDEIIQPNPLPRADDEWLDFARSFGVTGYHPVGTARMGAADDDLAVVDPTLRVRGIEALHIVDASVMPDIPSANTYAATLMIAEKAADLITERAAAPVPREPVATLAGEG